MDSLTRVKTSRLIETLKNSNFPSKQRLIWVTIAWRKNCTTMRSLKVTILSNPTVSRKFKRTQSLSSAKPVSSVTSRRLQSPRCLSLNQNSTLRRCNLCDCNRLIQNQMDSPTRAKTSLKETLKNLSFPSKHRLIWVIIAYRKNCATMRWLEITILSDRAVSRKFKRTPSLSFAKPASSVISSRLQSPRCPKLNLNSTLRRCNLCDYSRLIQNQMDSLTRVKTSRPTETLRNSSFLSKQRLIWVIIA